MLPPYMIEFQIAMDGIKRYTGWTDEELGKRLGVSAQTIRRARKNPCSVNGGLILQIQDLLRKLRKEHDML